MADSVALDLGAGDVHVPGAVSGEREVLNISQDKRDSLSGNQFALPAKRKYPLDTAARTRNAAARLEQMRKRGKVSESEYKEARGHIAAAAKKFGIESQYNESDKASSKPRAGHGSGAIHVRADLAPGGAIHVRHQLSANEDGSFTLRDARRIERGDEVDPSSAGVQLMGPDKWADGTPKKLVWCKVAAYGKFKGHASGEFEINAQTFADIIRNFEKRGLAIPWDRDHLSEQDTPPPGANETGIPAAGWIHKLDDRGVGGLWGLTEWLDKARDQVKSGEYPYCSPAIRFNAKDPVTGERCGARLTSCAMVTQPFLSSLGTLRAAKDSVVRVSDVSLSAIDRRVHGDVMGKLKSVLKMHSLDGPEHVRGRLSDLRQACMMAGDDGQFDGCDLSDFMSPLSDIAKPGLGSSWEDVLDALDEFVDEEIQKHVFQGVPMPDPGGYRPMSAAHESKTTVHLDDVSQNKTVEGTDPMSDSAVALKDATEKVTQMTAKVAALEVELSTAKAETSRLTLSLKDVQSKVDASDAQIAESKKLLDGKDAEIKTLKDAAAARAEQDILADVETAFATYKDSKKLSDKDKEHMVVFAKANIAAFRGMYPPVAVGERHLLSNLVKDEARPTVEDKRTFKGLCDAFMAKGPSFEAAQLEAQRALKNPPV